jgi:HAD superfamily hydrolase (TIGR01459 family)
MKHLSLISEIIPYYDAFLLDLWGVVHDGSHLYPGVYETLVALRESGKKVIFLSNAPRRADKVAVVLNNLGIKPELYEHIISSGEVGFQWLQNGGASWGKRYYFIGAKKDEDLLHDLDFQRVYDLKDADFLLNLGFGTDEQTSADFLPLLQDARKLSLPMLCLNPDLEVVKISGERFPCAGVLAKDYLKMGGDVTWFGKPYNSVYEHCHELLGGIDKSKILAVGDSLETDIPGANRFGVDCVLVTGGILKEIAIDDIKEMCAGLSLCPTYLIQRFGII